MAAQPAFTSVAARRTLIKEPASAPVASKHPSFAQPVVEYVQRAFFEFNKHKESFTFTDITDKDIRAKLSSVVNEATARGDVHHRDWDTYPLPHQLILEERQQAALRVAQTTLLANIEHPPEPRPSTASSPGLNGTKRKAVDEAVEDAAGPSVTPPWKKKNNNKTSLAERITTGKSKNQDKKRKENANFFDTSQDALERRKQRFGQSQASPEPSPFFSSRDESPSDRANNGPVAGTCQTLEKNYFRLTSQPHPSTVRPLPVLEKALDFVLSKWRAEHNYTYACDQLKSLRQDLTVQRIKTPFTIRVYENHARIALQMKDLGEYNQCQTQLRGLYKMRLGENGSSGGKRDEFTAYHVLYLIYTRNRTDMNNMLADLTTADKRGPFVQLALKVRAALASGNYHRFFQLYSQSQDRNMVPYLMDMFIERERLGAMAAISKAYKPDVSTAFLTTELAFECGENEAFEDDVHRACLEFIATHNGAHLVDQQEGGVRFLSGKAGLLFEQSKRSAFGKVDIKGQI